MKTINLKDYLKLDTDYMHTISGEVQIGAYWISDSWQWEQCTEEDLSFLVEVERNENGEWEVL